MAEKNKKGLLFRYFESNLLIRILIGLVLGAVLGIAVAAVWPHGSNVPERINSILNPFGDLFIRLLKMIIQPVIIFTLIVGTASISPSRLGKVGVKIIAFYLVTSFFAIIVGLIFGNLFQPGLGMNITGNAGAHAQTFQSPSLVNRLLSIVPTNPFQAFSSGEVLPTICFSIFFGISLAFCREHSQERIREASDIVFKFFEGGAEVIFKIVGWVMQYAPIGVFCLIFVVFSKQGIDAFGPLLKVTVTVYLALIAQFFLVYGGLLFFFKINPVKFYAKVRSPMITAFVTRSSGGTLPISMETADKDMGIAKGVYSFTLPLGATINMDGTTIYLGVCAIFIANAVGIPLTFMNQLTIVLTAVLASVGTAGVPGAGAIMLLMVLDSVGLKVTEGSAVAAAYGMIFGIDAILDMGRTSMNIGGDMAGTCIVAKSENEIDMDKWS